MKDKSFMYKNNILLLFQGLAFIVDAVGSHPPTVKRSVFEFRQGIKFLGKHCSYEYIDWFCVLFIKR
jgi:hypothetical protein